MTHAPRPDHDPDGGGADDDHGERSTVAEAGERLRLRLRVARDLLVDVVEQHPLTAVGAAASIGFIFARLMRR